MIYCLKWVWGLRTIGIARQNKHVGPQALSPTRILSTLLAPTAPPSPHAGCLFLSAQISWPNRRLHWAT